MDGPFSQCPSQPLVAYPIHCSSPQVLFSPPWPSLVSGFFSWVSGLWCSWCPWVYPHPSIFKSTRLVPGAAFSRRHGLCERAIKPPDSRPPFPSSLHISAPHCFYVYLFPFPHPSHPPFLDLWSSLFSFPFPEPRCSSRAQPRRCLLQDTVVTG